MHQVNEDELFWHLATGRIGLVDGPIGQTAPIPAWAANIAAHLVRATAKRRNFILIDKIMYRHLLT